LKTPLATLIFRKAKITFSVNKLELSRNIRGSEGENDSKFKAEMCLLLMAIALFVVSAVFYSYPEVSEGRTFSLASSNPYPYRVLALTFVGFGSVLMLTASISFSKRSKNVGHETLPSLAEDKAYQYPD
jgi:hypothetical protein